MADDKRPETTKGTVESRVASARQDATRAEKDLEAASLRRLETLKRQSVEKRFAALGDDDPVLLPQHRRELLKTLQGQQIDRAMPVHAGFASRWERFRARLPYRAFTFGLLGIAVVVGAVLLLVARARTPPYSVVSLYSTPVSAEFRTAGGVRVFDRIEPGTRYAVVREAEGVVVLRQWDAGTGYATATVPAAWLQRLP